MKKIRKFGGDYSDVFSKLPFRVVVTDVLSYHEILDCSDLGPFALFGYFKRDRCRFIFQIFTSLRVNRDVYSLLNARRVLSLSIFFPTEKLLKKLIGASQCMKNLDQLTLITTHDLVDLFSKKECFPRLQRFILTDKARISRSYEKWKTARHIWRGLKTFQIQVHTTNEIFLPLFDDPKEYLQSVNHFSFSGVRFFADKALIPQIHLPKLRTIEFPFSSTIHSCVTRNFPLGNVEKLKSMTFYLHCGSRVYEYFKKLFLKSPKLEEVRIFSYQDSHSDELDYANRCIDFAFLPRPTPLKKMSIGGSRIHWSSWDCPLNTSFIDNIEEFTCDDPNLSSILQCTHWNFPILKKVNISNAVFRPLFDGEFTAMCENLTNLMIYRCRNLSDRLFQALHFPKLRVLRIGFCGGASSIEGEGWNELPELVVLELRALLLLKNSFFETMEFGKLEELRISHCDLVDGNNKWNERTTGSIRKLEIGGASFSNFLLKTPQLWPNLEDLEMNSCWTKNTTTSLDQFLAETKRKRTYILDGNMCLKIFVASNCSFGDLIFQCGWSEMLRELRLEKCDKITGKDWEFMKFALVVQIKECSRFNREEFLKNPPFDPKKVRVVLKQ